MLAHTDLDFRLEDEMEVGMPPEEDEDGEGGEDQEDPLEEDEGMM